MKLGSPNKKRRGNIPYDLVEVGKHRETLLKYKSIADILTKFRVRVLKIEIE